MVLGYELSRIIVTIVYYVNIVNILKFVLNYLLHVTYVPQLKGVEDAIGGRCAVDVFNVMLCNVRHL